MPTWISEEDRRRFRSDGYMVIRRVVPAHIVENAAREIAAFIGADLRDRSTWYRGAPQNDGIVPMHHGQSLWNIRQCPALHEVFSEFWDTHRLMVDINRCLFRPPRNWRHRTISRSRIHWDTDPRLPGPGSLQGVVLVSDVAGPNCGGYQCLPDIYQNLEAWLQRNAEPDFDFFNPGLSGLKTVQIEGNAGDVILWSTKLPHGSAANLSKHPRIAAFVSMQHPGRNDPAQMKTWWLTKQAPHYWRGLPGQPDSEPGPPAALTNLGLKLIGSLPWD